MTDADEIVEYKSFEPGGLWYDKREIAQMKRISRPGQEPEFRLIPRYPKFEGEELIKDPGEPLLEVSVDGLIGFD